MTHLPATVDVLVVNYKTPELTIKALDSLRGPDVRFWVRDNSGDLDARALEAVAGPSVRLLRDGRNSLYASGNNEIYALGSAPYVLLLNPDVLLARQSLETLLGALMADSGLWAVVPKLLNADGTPQGYYRRFPSLASLVCDRIPPARAILRGVWDRHTYAGESFEHRRAVESPPGACILFRRADVGERLFEEDLRLFFNDTALNLRMARRGQRVDVVPSATAFHVRGASLAQARLRDRYLVADLYDRDCLTFSRTHIRGWQLVLVLVSLRRATVGLLRLLTRLKELSGRMAQPLTCRRGDGAR